MSMSSMRSRRSLRPASARQGVISTLSRGASKRSSRDEAARGSVDNVLFDLGFRDAADLTAKVHLAVRINAILDRRGIVQRDASRLLGMTQPKISQLRRYKLRGISLERLMRALVALDHAVHITVRPASSARRADIVVQA